MNFALSTFSEVHIRIAPVRRASQGGAIIQLEGNIRALCMMGYASPILYIRNPAA